MNGAALGFGRNKAALPDVVLLLDKALVASPVDLLQDQRKRAQHFLPKFVFLENEILHGVPDLPDPLHFGHLRLAVGLHEVQDSPFFRGFL